MDDFDSARRAIEQMERQLAPLRAAEQALRDQSTIQQLNAAAEAARFIPRNPLRDDEVLLRSIRQMEHDLAPFREIDRALRDQQAVRDALSTSHIDRLKSALIDSELYRFSFANSIDRDVLLGIARAAQDASALTLAHKALYPLNAYYAAQALEGFDVNSLQLRLHLAPGSARGLVRRVRRHSEAVGLLLQEVPATPTPAEVLAADSASANLFVQSQFLTSLSDPSAEHERQATEQIGLVRRTTDTELEALLGRLEVSFVGRWHGARGALTGRNPEKARHVFISFRTLWDDVLNYLAPEPEVAACAGPDDFTITRDGNRLIKREARFRYVLRTVEYDRLATAMHADAAALVKLYGILNDVHRGNLVISDDDLTLLVLRIEGAIKFLLQAAFTRG
jgi:hypothetical protein